jgi:hypothetical protein
MKAQSLGLVLLLASGLNSVTLLAAEEPDAVTTETTEKTRQISDPIRDIIQMRRAGVEPGVMYAYLGSVTEIGRLTASNVVQLWEEAVPTDVMTELIRRSSPGTPLLSADDIIRLHEKGVPSDLIAALIHKGRTGAIETTAAAPAVAKENGNPKYYLAGPRTSSVYIIPYRPYSYSPYSYYGSGYSSYPRYYGPSFSYGLGFGCGRRFCW